MRLTGIELRNFRSIGSEPVVLTPWRKCNILVGQNNVGKSNVLKALKKLSDRHQRGGNNASLSELDLFRRSHETSFVYKLWFEATAGEDDSILSRLTKTNSFWFEISWQLGQSPRVVDHTFACIKDRGQSNDLLEYLAHRHWSRGVSPEDIRREFLDLGNEIFLRFSLSIPQVYIIPEFRQIREGTQYNYDGTGLVDLLAHYHIPDIGKDSDQRKFEKIQKFFRKLLHLPQAILEVSHEAHTLIVKNDDLRLPLASFGTGVHELLILVTAVLSIEDAICCIEEPEIHLHPRLQREMVEFLISETSNQYLLSTHSATLINSASSSVQVFHLRSQNGATTGAPVLQDDEGLRAIRDLGAKASDLLQANCIIWVEGLSDRVYIRRWIELVAPDLAEGRDYVFMCYSQLQRLNLDRDIFSAELVNVLKLNQNAIVVMDSDRNSELANQHPRKREMQEQCEQSGGVGWITNGREIENYLPARVIASACKELRGAEIEVALQPFDEFEQVVNRALREAGVEPILYSKEKLNYARKFAEHFVADDIGKELKEHLDRITAAIRDWNK